jgi:hypothetical protein
MVELKGSASATAGAASAFAAPARVRRFQRTKDPKYDRKLVRPVSMNNM